MGAVASVVTMRAVVRAFITCLQVLGARKPGLVAQQGAAADGGGTTRQNQSRSQGTSSAVGASTNPSSTGSGSSNGGTSSYTGGSSSYATGGGGCRSGAQQRKLANDALQHLISALSRLTAGDILRGVASSAAARALMEDAAGVKAAVEGYLEAWADVPGNSAEGLACMRLKRWWSSVKLLKQLLTEQLPPLSEAERQAALSFCAGCGKVASTGAKLRACDGCRRAAYCGVSGAIVLECAWLIVLTVVQGVDASVPASSISLDAARWVLGN